MGFVLIHTGYLMHSSLGWYSSQVCSETTHLVYEGTGCHFLVSGEHLFGKMSTFLIMYSYSFLNWT